MAVPPELSEWENLQSSLIRVQNLIVREEFSDALDNDISTPRSQLKRACTHQDDDSAIMSLIRLDFFYIVLRKAQDYHPAIYGMPTTSFQEVRKFLPQIQLYFLEDLEDVAEGYKRVSGEISFRLMNQTAETLSEAELRTYGTKVKSSFGAANGFVWKKGKVQASYFDSKRGYRLKIHCRSESEGKRVIEQALDIQSHTPDWKNLNISQNDEVSQAFPTIPPTDLILGKTRRLPRKRPIADVRFQYAVSHIYGLPNPVVLYDRVYKFRKALVSR